MDVSPFVGTSRELLVEGLVGLFDEVRASGESRWVLLEAPSGWGKTRVGKEFYAQLAKKQSSPSYWPERIDDTTHKERKGVSPVGKREAGSLPEFLWWGLSCSSYEGAPAPALRNGVDWLKDHSTFVSVALQKSRPRLEGKIQELATKRWEIAQEGALEAAAQVANAAGAAVPGLGLMVMCARWWTGAVRERRSNRQMVAEASEMGSSQGGLVEEVVTGLSEFGRAGFPVVLFVEDLHHGG